MDIKAVQAHQDGVISRRQLIEAEVSDTEIKRLLRRRELTRVFPGVYVNHSGPLTWRQRAWAAVLFHWPAALAGSWALHAAGVRGHEPSSGSPVEVCVDRDRSVRRHVGIHVRQIVRYETLCQTNTSPPRERIEHATLDVASRRRRLEGSVAVLADAVQCGSTTPARLVAALDERPRIRHRAMMRAVLADVAVGVRSVLEYRYLTWVERAHGLPGPRRQRRATVGGEVTYRDVDYPDFGVSVELDGRIAHDGTEDGWADIDRDLSAVVAGELTLRARWKQVLEPCRLARAVATILQARGWTGDACPCGPDCAAFSTPGVEDVAQIG